MSLAVSMKSTTVGCIVVERSSSAVGKIAGVVHNSAADTKPVVVGKRPAAEAGHKSAELAGPAVVDS